MTITVELPEDLAAHTDPTREAIVEFAIECYRKEALSLRRAAAMLDLYWLDFQALLKERGVTEGVYGADDFLEDVRTMDRLRAEGRLGG